MTGSPDHLLEAYRLGYMTEDVFATDHEYGVALTKRQCWACTEDVVMFPGSATIPMCPEHYLRYPRTWQVQILDD